MMLKPADGLEGVKQAILNIVAEAGPNACPPMVVGVGIGGTFEKCALMAKEALTREVGVHSEIPYVQELEEEMRILYVATTRAQQQMHIVDCIQALEDYKKPLTMSGVYDRGGYTSWILQSFLTHPSALFTIKEVHQMWENIPVEKEVSIYQEIPHYHKTHQPMKFSSATSITSTEELPAFQPKSGAGMSYGTRMHHMIEHLPNTSWDKEIITSCAKDLQISLKEYDITSLLQLGNHPFYQSLFSKTCYHELPFMVKIKDEILHGFMDFVAMDDTSMTIIDF